MRAFITLALLGLATAACGGGSPAGSATQGGGKAATGMNVLTRGSAAAPAEPEEPATPPAAPAEQDGAAMEDPTEVPYAYSPIGKRDPFRNLFDVLQQEESQQELTELQKFELDQLRLVAVVSRISTPYAMVEDPSGKGHTLTRGTLIGKNWGQVSQIREDCVVINEEYRDYTGRKVTNKTSLCLPKPEELKLD
ncbi:MAG TPA: pilus assembly protein PilP [Myxococcales bacterium LLY-WYZ-16_1]|jgi:type IV pilus assembly protein PilP|nr:pilus assembly protein PilP [Myxococcales bacterium LLY-WYZ-16_1]